MKTIIRNLLSIVRRFRVATVLNIFGLSVAFAAFIVIMIQVTFERSYDRCHPKAERIFRADFVSSAGVGIPEEILPRQFANALITSSAHIEAGTPIVLIDEWLGETHILTGDSSDLHGFNEPYELCYPDITRMFGFEFVEGTGDCLSDPEKVIIPSSMAKRMFGNESAIGKQIHSDTPFDMKDRMTSLTVGGVYRDFPDNTQIKNVIYTAIDHTESQSWGESNFMCYVLLDNKSAAAQVEAELNRSFDFSATNLPDTHIRLTALTDIYFSGTGLRTGSANTVRLLFAIALLVLVIAAINYMNFSIAMTPMRIRSINTQKILGSSDAALRRALVAEALIIALISWILAIFIVEGLAEYNILSFFDADLHIQSHIPLVAATGAVAVIIGLVAGIYPAFYATSFKPALVLKGSFGLSPAGRRLRTALIGLIIAASFIQLQGRYMRTFDQGFDKEQIAIVKINRNMYVNRDTYTNRMKEYAGIDDVAFSQQKFGGADMYATWSYEYQDKLINAFTVIASSNFLDVMGIPVTSGRDFLPGEMDAFNFEAILSKPVANYFDVSEGDRLRVFGGRIDANVVGMVDELKMSSLRHGEDKIVFLKGIRVDMLPYSYIRIKAGANVFDAVEHIRRSVAAIDPTYPVDVEFYDAVFNELYQKEENLNKSISLLSLLAIIISIVGVFGLVLFETEYRRKEIGIRKVFGSTTGEILIRFNKVYVRILCICFVIAAPLAWYGVHRWLENFAYKTPMYVWVYALAFLIVLILTVATVTFQNWQAARSNPVESIKSE